MQQAVTPNGEIVRIGVIGSFSGNDSHIGSSGLLGVRTYLKAYPFLNGGEKLELEIRDDTGTKAGVLKAIEELAALDVAAILLLSNSTVALSLAPVADDFGLPIIATIATHPAITRNNNTIIQLCFDDDFQSNVAALFTRDELLIDRVGVFSNPSSPYSTYLAQSFMAYFQEVGGIITQHVELGDTPIDLEATLEHLQFMDTELLYVPIAPLGVVEISQKAKEIGWDPRLLASDGLHSQFLLNREKGREAIEGILTTDVYIKPSLFSKLLKRATEVFQSHYDEPGTSFTALGFEAALILAQSMQKCSQPGDAKCILSTLTSNPVFEGLIDSLEITRDGKTIRPVYLNTVHKNHQVFKIKVY